MSIIRGVSARAARSLYFYTAKYDCSLINHKSLKAHVAEVMHWVNATLSRYEEGNKCLCSGIVQYTIQQGIKGRKGSEYAQSCYQTARQLADLAGIEL